MNINSRGLFSSFGFDAKAMGVCMDRQNYHGASLMIFLPRRKAALQARNWTAREFLSHKLDIWITKLPCLSTDIVHTPVLNTTFTVVGELLVIFSQLNSVYHHTCPANVKHAADSYRTELPCCPASSILLPRGVERSARDRLRFSYLRPRTHSCCRM